MAGGVCLDSILASDPETAEQGLRQLKDLIIGNKRKKDTMVRLNAVPVVVDALRRSLDDFWNDDRKDKIAVQASAALGSFAASSPSGASSVRKAGGIEELLRAVRDSVEKESRQVILKSASRALKAIIKCQIPEVIGQMFADSSTIPLLLSLSSHPDIEVAELAANAVAAASYINEDDLESILKAGGMLKMVDLLFRSEVGAIRVNDMGMTLEKGTRNRQSRLQESTLFALEKLTDNRGGCSELHSSGKRIVNRLSELTRNVIPRIRLLACTCLANLGSSGILSDTEEDAFASSLLPKAISLMDSSDTETATGAPLLLKRIVEERTALQDSACGAGTVSRLAFLLKEADGKEIMHRKCRSPAREYADLESSFESDVYTLSWKSEMRKNVLIALAALCAHRDYIRQQIVDNKCLDYIVKALRDPDIDVCIAAATCIRSLSRSVRHLRTTFVRSDITTPLMAMVNNDRPLVQLTAVKTINNFVLHFYPMKQAIIDAGCIEKMATFLQPPFEYNGDKLSASSQETHMQNGYMSRELRCSALGTLRNMCYLAPRETKQRVMQSIGWETMKMLIFSDDLETMRLTIILLQNLVLDRGDLETMVAQIYNDTAQSNMKGLVQFCGNLDAIIATITSNCCRLVSMVAESQQTDFKSLGKMRPVELAVTAIIHLTSNIAAVSETARDLIMESTIPRDILKSYASISSPEPCIALSWLVVNVTRGDEISPREKRASKLTSLGYDTALHQMAKNDNVEVRQRAEMALLELEKALGTRSSSH